MIQSQRYVVSAWMFTDVGLDAKLGSVPVVCTALSYKIGGTNQLGAGTEDAGEGKTPAIGVSPSTDGAMLSIVLLLADCYVTCCYRGCTGDVGRTILMVSPFFPVLHRLVN